MEMSKRLIIRGKSVKHTTHPLIVVALIALGFAVGRLSITASWAASGTLDSSAPPESTFSYTLEDIYNRLNDGTTGAQSAFAEPTSGPTAGTGHTLDEIYDLIGERAPVPKTGQTLCYTATAGESEACPEDSGTYPGQDGDHQKGVAWPSPRFITSTMGTVTDTLTGLIWLQDANCIQTQYPGFDTDGTAGDGRVNWQHALNFVAGINAGTYPDCGAPFADWRLPNVRELQSLVNYGHYGPALPDDHPFTDVQSYVYWSSTSPTGNSSSAWDVHLADGSVGTHPKASTFHVWPVRGGQ